MNVRQILQRLFEVSADYQAVEPLWLGLAGDEEYGDGDARLLVAVFEVDCCGAVVEGGIGFYWQDAFLSDQFGDILPVVNGFLNGLAGDTPIGHKFHEDGFLVLDGLIDEGPVVRPPVDV